MNECILGLIICILLYGLGQLLYPNPIQQSIEYTRAMAQTIPEPNNLLKNFGEAVDMIYGREEE